MSEYDPDSPEHDDDMTSRISALLRRLEAQERIVRVLLRRLHGERYTPDEGFISQFEQDQKMPPDTLDTN